MSQNVQKIKVLQNNVEIIRNICIIAHVDHGKTTLADYLIANNGIISTRNAGPMRYLDNRPDEQERKITMKASNITLYFKSTNEKEYLINLIDSPGHVDFSSETNVAVKLADGAIIVVDVIEGVCAQTRVILQQAYKENIKLILFLNKIDRLILERNMNTTEAEEHLRRVVEQINAVMGNIFAADVLLSEDTTSKGNQESALEAADDSTLYFNPTEGNVIFGSAQDGWGFSLELFSEMFTDKLNVPAKELNNAMWGDFYYNTKHKRCDTGAFSKGKPSIFVQVILENIWKLYNNIMMGDIDKIPEYCEKLKLKYRPPKTSTANRKTILKSICMEWLPLDKIIFEKIVRHVTSPADMYQTKINKLVSKEDANIEFSDDDSSKVIGFIAKMVPISYRELIACDRALRDIEDEYEADEQVLIAFCRIYCGVLRENSNVYLVKRDYNPKIKNKEELEPVDIKRIYLMMSRNFEPIQEACAGMIVGIWGLQKYVTKSATLTSSKNCPPFSGLDILAPPVLRVAVETKNIDDMPKLIKGLKLLNQVDSCVQIMIQDTGEHVLCVLGEVHLEKCIRDLTEDYAKIQLNVSKPIVQFRETIVEPLQKSLDDDKSALISTRNNTCTVKIVALPLSQNIVKFLESKKEKLKIFTSNFEEDSSVEVNKDFQISFSNEIKNSACENFELHDIWSIGPKKLGTCLLVNKSKYIHRNLWSADSKDGQYDRAIINGFQTAVQAGPLCQEPMHGVCFIMQEFLIDESVDKHDSSITGIIITSVKEACRIAFQKQPQRLVGPMYNLSVTANGDVLGKCYAEISKRNGRVLISDMIEGSGMWILEAVIPVIESFDLANELRVKTSGLAMPQMGFSHWETIEQDPFWIPTTEDELEQFGDKADFENKAKSYMDSIRERKGLYVDKKLVEFAEKQRTLSKNK